MITFHLKRNPTVPLDGEVLSPDVVRDLSCAEIGDLEIHHGRRTCHVSDFFDVTGERSSDLVIEGDCRRIRWIGRSMSTGTITIRGDVGPHLGAYMRGGEIIVHGNASDWLGAEMQAGSIHVHGDAGNSVGGAYIGSPHGMRGGRIIITGTVGNQLGSRMRRGTIAVGGEAGSFAGLEMKGGTIILASGAGGRPGASMKRGTIVSLEPLQVMDTFSSCSSYNPTFLRVYARALAETGVGVPFDESEGNYRRFAGDAYSMGKGEILVWQPATKV